MPTSNYSILRNMPYLREWIVQRTGGTAVPGWVETALLDLTQRVGALESGWGFQVLVPDMVVLNFHQPSYTTGISIEPFIVPFDGTLMSLSVNATFSFAAETSGTLRITTTIERAGEVVATETVEGPTFPIFDVMANDVLQGDVINMLFETIYADEQPADTFTDLTAAIVVRAPAVAYQTVGA